MVLTIRIICLVGKINIPLPTSKEGHECGVIPMAEPEREPLEEISTQNGPFDFNSNSMSSCVSQ